VCFDLAILGDTFAATDLSSTEETLFKFSFQTASDLTDAYLEPQPLWEYPGKPISDQFDILHLDFSRPLNTIKVIEREGFLPLCT